MLCFVFVCFDIEVVGTEANEIYQGCFGFVIVGTEANGTLSKKLALTPAAVFTLVPRPAGTQCKIR